MRRIRTERGLDRLVNFSDATVAIAITLLILPLVDRAGEIADSGSFGEFFLENYGAFIAFIVTFLVIGRFWMTHHRLFEAVADYSVPLIWINLIWLASIAFLPFAANAVSALPIDSGSVYALYIGTMLVTTVTSMLIEILLRRNAALVRPEARGTIELVPAAAMVILLVVAGVLAVLVPRIGMLWLLLLLLAGPLGAFLRRAFPRLRADAAASADPSVAADPSA
jgi:uncharacterized membrane protein